jgi:hypothetical protein
MYIILEKKCETVEYGKNDRRELHVVVPEETGDGPPST